MSKEDNKLADSDIYAASKPNMLAQTIGINRIAANTPGTNGYALRNETILARDKAAICKKNGNEMPATAKALHAQTQRNINTAVAASAPRKNIYKKGFTVLGTTGVALEAEAANIEIDHSRKLMRNYLVANPGMARLLETDAHHIVAWLAARAADARIYIFGVGIGINDTDNCAVMPRFLTSAIASMPNAIAHQHIHTLEYYANVYFELISVPEYTQSAVREALRGIRRKLIAGTFPY